jgi:hypothetical protein
MNWWIPVDLVFEASRLRTRSGRRDILGFGGTVRDKIGFEKKGKKKLVPKRKRPKRNFGDLLSRSSFRSSSIRSR